MAFSVVPNDPNDPNAQYTQAGDDPLQVLRARAQQAAGQGQNPPAPQTPSPLEQALANPLPQSDGKLKTLWDAVRQTDPNAQPVAPSTILPGIASGPGQAATSPGGASSPQVAPSSVLAPAGPPNAAPAAAAAVQEKIDQTPITPQLQQLQAKMGGPSTPSDPAAPVVDMGQGGPVPDTSQMDPGSGPATGIVPMDPNNLPTSARLKQLEQAQQTNDQPTLMQKIGRLAIPLAATGIGSIFGAGGAAAHGANESQKTQMQLQQEKRQSLTSQIESAQRSQSQEYNTAERTRELAEAANEAAQARRAVARTGLTGKVAAAQIGADSRENVAGTQVQGRRDVAGIQGDTARDVADTRADASEYGADRRVAASKYAADAAANRQTRGFDHSDAQLNQREQFSVDKPTAAEDQRMDMSNSTQQYIKEMKEIAARRPELFGPLAGRMTEMYAKGGSSDPDISAIGRIQEQLGTTMQAAHSLRNATHIETAAQKVANIHQSPESFIKNLDDQSNSLNMFSNVYRPTVNGSPAGPKRLGPQTANPAATTSTKANDPLGIR